MGVTNDGRLVAGYGDWGSNVDSFGVNEGGVYSVPLDLATGEWEMQHAIRAGSEALDTIREINGDLYMPTTDPSDSGLRGSGPQQTIAHREMQPTLSVIIGLANLETSSMYTVRISCRRSHHIKYMKMAHGRLIQTLLTRFATPIQMLAPS